VPQNELEDTTPPDAPLILSPEDNPFTSTATLVSFSGTTEVGSIVEALYLFDSSTSTATTTVSTDVNWNLEIELNQGTTTISFTAEDFVGNISLPTERIVFVDSIAPDVEIRECENSLSTSGCLTATTTLLFSWESLADDTEYFLISENGFFSTTTATSTEVTAEDNAIYTFAVSVFDVLGNQSATSTQEVEVATLPVVINEIAWMGTSASTADEWIELYNPTGKDISLENWVLYSSDNSPSVSLEATISSGGYYLLERTDNSTIADISADAVYTGALDNGGDTLYLERPGSGTSTVLVDIAPATCNGNWCGGSNSLKRTMERIDPLTVGEDENNWSTALGEFIQNGTDAAAGAIGGTPRSRNSVTSLVSQSGTLTEDKTLSKADSPYLVARAGLTK